MGDEPVGFIGESVEPTVAQSGFQSLAQRDDFLMDGTVTRWFAAVCHGFLVSVRLVFLDLPAVISEMDEVPEERDQVNA